MIRLLDHQNHLYLPNRLFQTRQMTFISVLVIQWNKQADLTKIKITSLPHCVSSALRSPTHQKQDLNKSERHLFILILDFLYFFFNRFSIAGGKKAEHNIECFICHILSHLIYTEPLKGQKLKENSAGFLCACERIWCAYPIRGCRSEFIFTNLHRWFGREFFIR